MRILLLSVIAGLALYVVALAILTRELTADHIFAVAFLGAAFWYFAFGEQVARYERARHELSA